MPRASVQHFLRDAGGAVSVIAALSIMMLLAVSAIVVDAGSLYLARRNLQSANDAAALAAVQNPAGAAAIAASVFANNGYSGPSLTVTTGVYTADESLSANDRFVAAGTGINAVRVRASVQQPTFFASLFGLASLSTLTTQATAARVPTASFGAGTRLAELNGGILNSLLGKLWGSNVTLSLIDYQALLSTNVDALTFLNNLATEANVTGSYQNLANASVTMGQLLDALVQTTGTAGAVNGDPTGAQLALQALQLQLAAGPALPLGSLVDLSPLYGRSIGNVASVDNTGLQMNLMSLLSASALTMANGQTTDMGTVLSVPIANSSINTRISVGSQMAQVADAQVGTSIHPAQIRIALTATLTNINLGVASATVQVPIFVQVAFGQATLTAMPCRVGGTLAEIAATSGATTLQFGTVGDAALKDFSASVSPAAAPVVNISLLGIPIQVNIAGSGSVASSGPLTLSFTQGDIDAGAVKSVPGGSAMPFAALSSGFTLSTTILGNPGVLAGLLNTQLSSLTAALNPVIAGLLAQLDAPVNNLMTTLGLQLGVIDVRFFDTSCRTPTLVG